MSRDMISPDIPWMRKLAHEVLTVEYASTEAAMTALDGFPSVYADRYPDHAEQWGEAVEAAVPQLREMYRTHVFPEMNIGWDTYYSLIGHPTKNTAGCFRCHDGLLRDEEGRGITLACDSCHHVLARDEPDPAILRQLKTVRGVQ